VQGATWTEGRFGGALAFNGRDASVNLFQRPDFDFGKQTDFTVECWVRVPPEAGPGTRYVVTSRLRGDMPGFGLVINRGMCASATVADKVWSVTVQDRVPLNDGTWHHLAFVAARKGEARLYVDGKLAAARDMSFILGVTNVDRPLRLGDRGHDDGFFEGCIDEVRISRGVVTNFNMTSPYGD
jgi:sialidase-1